MYRGPNECILLSSLHSEHILQSSPIFVPIKSDLVLQHTGLLLEEMLLILCTSLNIWNQRKCEDNSKDENQNEANKIILKI